MLGNGGCLARATRVVVAPMSITFVSAVASHLLQQQPTFAACMYVCYRWGMGRAQVICELHKYIYLCISYVGMHAGRQACMQGRVPSCAFFFAVQFGGRIGVPVGRVEWCLVFGKF